MIFVLIGLTVTSFITEYFSMIPGGLIVPVFLAAYILKPEAIIGTFIVASISLIFLFFLNQFFLIQKKKRLIITIAISSIIVFFWRKYLPSFFPDDLLFEAVGWVIPGILSMSMQKNGYFKTLIFTLFVTLCLLPMYFFFIKIGNLF